MLTRNALLPEYRDFLASINPNVYPTFNFGYPVSIEVGQGSLVHFFNGSSGFLVGKMRGVM